MNEVEALPDRVVKRYSGTIDRGFEKLRAEHRWFMETSEQLRSKYPLALPEVIDFRDSPKNNLTELHLSKVPRHSLTKEILSGGSTPERAQAGLFSVLEVLIEDLYPIRGAEMEGSAIYARYHAQRMALARKYLRRIPYLHPILDATAIRVNGEICPSVNMFLIWLDEHAAKIFTGGHLVAFHGNFHLDNILLEKSVKPTRQSITLIDPRGDLMGPPHSDLAKLLITLEGFYDEIHYGGFSLSGRNRGKVFDINIRINRTHDREYSACLAVLPSFLESFFSSEDVNIESFLWSTYTTECIHILSFCFYHAYRLDTDPNRIRAFMAIFALLARRVIEAWELKTPPVLPGERLEIAGI